jgi:hypothetical protein
MVLCPVCSRSDSIVQLSSAGLGKGGDASARMFPPPAMPRYPRLERMIGFSLAFLLLGGGILLFRIYDALIAMFLIIGGFIFIACFINDEKDRRGAWVEKKLEWQAATEAWKSLYFCERDGIIFNPDTGEIVPSENLDNYVYQLAPPLTPHPGQSR